MKCAKNFYLRVIEKKFFEVIENMVESKNNLKIIRELKK